jgi:hypothetical protein
MYREPSSPPTKDGRHTAATAISQAHGRNTRNGVAPAPPAASGDAVAARHDASVEEALGARDGGMMGVVPLLPGMRVAVAKGCFCWLAARHGAI